MDPPKPSQATLRISANVGTAGQYANSPMRVVELKGKTAKGQHYLQLSLGALQELAALLENTGLSEHDKVTFNSTYDAGKARYDGLVELRDQLLMQKKSFRSFFVNLFVRESDATRFLKTTYWNYSTIKRASDELHRRLLPDRNDILAASESGSLQESNTSLRESPPDVVENNVSVQDLPQNETLRGINLDVNTEQEAYEALGILNRIATFSGEENDNDVDDDNITIRASSTQSRPPSPSPSVTIIYNINNINNSVLSIDSEVTGAAVNIGVNEGIISFD